jgi:molybdenum cofactor cytidylyltransferase
MAGDLLSAYHAVVIASRGQVYAVHERVAGIILAAGEARRFGRPKQVLEWDGETLAHRAARVALQAGLDPVVAVTGAHAELVEASLQGLTLRIAKNPNWQDGQSASLRAGLEAVPPEAGAVIFLLADQPYVSTMLLQALVEMHACTLAPIVAPQIDGQRGNPVLFDRATFDDLRALSGDAGGRQLFARYPITWLPWHDASVLVDIDVVSDLARLR